MRTAHQVFRKATITHHIKLEPKWVFRVFCHILNRTNRHGGERKRHTELFSCLGRQYLTIGMHHTRHADRTKCHGHHSIFADNLCCHRTIINIDRDTLAKLLLLQCCFIVKIGALGPRASICIFIKHFRHALLGECLKIVYVGNDWHGHVSPCWSILFRNSFAKFQAKLWNSETTKFYEGYNHATAKPNGP